MFAIPMIGAVIHTINVRLSPEQILYTMNHAEDRFVLVNSEFASVVEDLRDKLPAIYDALTLPGTELTLEVQQQLGDGIVRTIALGSSDGIRRGACLRQEIAMSPAQVELARTRNLLLGIRQHLLPLGQPSHRARDREQRSKHLRSEAHGLIHNPGVEVDIGIQLALDEVIVFQSDAL